ncbi:Glycosyltransferase involved in cell wall bisynthesis [Salegentibacter holothuriorum]|uniref:Glycosyltransferase involved in cell wall bisynthesis n=1 Tax=Salegentibacter holothuriorum TaxID=241145 RepID=A0A1T5APA5_9FLAO|nr:glycosyltransferase family A protein [Salegentibacter holothuriorum]SKB36891.1 Glycosyltransferase involved in cell wall bisynthesis [Salegentibacter holothuriorum]
MISIITPSFNRAYLLPRMIESVLRQTFKNWELIIMDDGSTDNTKEVVEAYNDSRIKYFYTENSGAADKRNQGVEKSQYEFIIFLDSDDEVVSNWLTEFVHQIRKNKANIVSCGGQKCNSKGEVIGTILPVNLGPLFQNIKANFMAGSILYHKRYFIESGGFDRNLKSGQHTDLFLRIITDIPEIELKVFTINKPLVRVYLHTGTRIRHDNNAVYSGTVLFIKKHKKLLTNNPAIFSQYLSIAGVSAIRTKKYKEANSFFYQAIKCNKGNLKLYFQLIVSFIPFFRDKFWQQNS